MGSSLPPFTEEQKEQYRRYFAGLRLADQMERDRVRGEAIDPVRCRAAYDALWERIREMYPEYEGDSEKDEQAESRVARAVARVPSHRAGREVA